MRRRKRGRGPCLPSGWERNDVTYDTGLRKGRKDRDTLFMEKRREKKRGEERGFFGAKKALPVP